MTLAVFVALDGSGTSALTTLLLSNWFATGAFWAIEDLTLFVAALEWEVCRTHLQVSHWPKKKEQTREGQSNLKQDCHSRKAGTRELFADAYRVSIVAETLSGGRLAVLAAVEGEGLHTLTAVVVQVRVQSRARQLVATEGSIFRANTSVINTSTAVALSVTAVSRTGLWDSGFVNCIAKVDGIGLQGRANVFTADFSNHLAGTGVDIAFVGACLAAIKITDFLLLGSITDLGACVQGILGELAVCWEVDSALESNPGVMRKVRDAISSSYSRGMLIFHTLNQSSRRTVSLLVLHVQSGLHVATEVVEALSAELHRPVPHFLPGVGVASSPEHS